MSEQKPMEQIPRDGNYSEAEDKSLQDSDSDDSKVSEEPDQQYRAQGVEEAPQQQIHHSRPTIGVKQPVSRIQQQNEDDYSESELESADEKPQQPQVGNAVDQRYVSQSIQSSYSNESDQQKVNMQTGGEQMQSDDEDLPSDSEFQNQMQEKKNKGQSLWGMHQTNTAAPAIAPAAVEMSISDKSSEQDEDNYQQPTV